MKLVGVLLLACACGRIEFDARGVGDGGPDAVPDDSTTNPLDGFWVVTEALVPGETQVRTRADLIDGIRSDVHVSGTSFIHRSMRLAGGVGAEPPQVDLHQYALDGDTLIVMTSDIGNAAYAFTWTGPDVAAMQLLPDDPRTTTGAPGLFIDDIVLQRTAPPMAMLVGTWAVTRIAYQEIPEFATNMCTPDGGGSLFVTGTVDIPSTFTFDVALDKATFSAPACTNPSGTYPDSGTGYLEATGSDYMIWVDFASSAPVRFTGVVTPTLSGLGLRLEHTSCTGDPGCVSQATLVELEPR